MASLQSQLDWIEGRREFMLSRLREWCEINTGSYNTSGLAHQCERLEDSFGSLGNRCQTLPLPAHKTVNDDGEVQENELGDLLLVSNRAEADRSVMLGAHMDTVFGPESSFQSVEDGNSGRLIGPGIIDDKGGIVVLLVALQALQRSEVGKKVGWEVFINSDEEIGSPGSKSILKERAGNHEFGLIFEPPMPDGTMVTRRKGSGNFSIVVEGQSAHAGRNPEEGNDAVRLLSSLILDLHELDDRENGVICNVGRVVGGGPVNIVPDKAVAHLNIRVDTAEDKRTAETTLGELLDEYDSRNNFNVTLHGEFLASPKELTGPNRMLLNAIRTTADHLNIDFGTTDSGGVTDGNVLCEAGLPTMDTLGPVGGKIHTSNEYLRTDSLTRRAKLAFLVLHRFACEDLFPDQKPQSDTG